MRECTMIAASLYRHLWTPKQQGRSEPPGLSSTTPEPRRSLPVQGQALGRHGQVQPPSSKERISVLGRTEPHGSPPRPPKVEHHAGPPREGLVLIMTRPLSHAASAAMSGVRAHVQGHEHQTCFNP